MGIAEEVVSRLLGEPNGRLSRGRRLRYRNKGSLSVDLDKAAFFDFEAGTGGGLSKLVEREIGGDWKAARRWLEEQGLKDPWKPTRGGGKRPVGCRAGRGRGGRGGSGRGSAVRRPVGAPRGDPESGREEGKEERRIALARALWAATVAAAGTPLARYLARRGVWPALSVPAIPGALRWADRAALERVDRGLLFGDEERPFPVDAAGAMVAAFTPAGGGAQIRAVSVNPLTAEGWRPEKGSRADGKRWRKHRGVMRGAVCRMEGNPHGHEIALVEGEIDAVAVAFAARYSLLGLGDVAEVRAVGGSGFEPDRAADGRGRPVVLLPDGARLDEPALTAGKAAGCAYRLRAAGRFVRVRGRRPGAGDNDPAADLAELVVERMALIDEGGVMGAGAEVEAWRVLLEPRSRRRTVTRR